VPLMNGRHVAAASLPGLLSAPGNLCVPGYLVCAGSMSSDMATITTSWKLGDLLSGYGPYGKAMSEQPGS